MNSKNYISDTLGFFLTMIPSLIMGTGSALGEATIIGALRNYPKNLITGWSSGTGMAGISGALLTLIFKMFKIETQLLYLIVSPLSLVFLAVFFLQEKMFNEYIKPRQSLDSVIVVAKDDTGNIQKRTSIVDNVNDIESENTQIEEENNPIDERPNKFTSTDDNLNLSFKNLNLAYRYSSMFIVNLGLVNIKLTSN